MDLRNRLRWMTQGCASRLLLPRQLEEKGPPLGAAGRGPVIPSGQSDARNHEARGGACPGCACTCPLRTQPGSHRAIGLLALPPGHLEAETPQAPASSMAGRVSAAVLDRPANEPSLPCRDTREPWTRTQRQPHRPSPTGRRGHKSFLFRPPLGNR